MWARERKRSPSKPTIVSVACTGSLKNDNKEAPIKQQQQQQHHRYCVYISGDCCWRNTHSMRKWAIQHIWYCMGDLKQLLFLVLLLLLLLLLCAAFFFSICLNIRCYSVFFYFFLSFCCYSFVTMLQRELFSRNRKSLVSFCTNAKPYTTEQFNCKIIAISSQFKPLIWFFFFIEESRIAHKNANNNCNFHIHTKYSIDDWLHQSNDRGLERLKCNSVDLILYNI